MKNPLGISDFGTLRIQGYHYIDKTPFLAHLEDLSPLYLLFHRPPGTGKSTFLSMLAYYYDLAQASCGPSMASSSQAPRTGRWGAS